MRGAAHVFSRGLLPRILILLTLGATVATGAEPLARWDGWPGPVRGELNLSATAKGDFSLVTTGAAGARDTLALHVARPGRARFVFSHEGRRTAESDEIAIESVRPHQLLVSLGSLLPPLRSEIYWARPQHLHLASELLVMLDGKVVLARPAKFSLDSSSQIVFNERIFAHVVPVDESEVAAAVLPLMARGVVRDAVWRGFPGPVRLAVRAAADAAGERQPLLSTGRLGAGDLIYWSVQPDGRARIGFSHAGAGTIESEPLPLRVGAQEILISADGLLPPADDELAQREPDVARLRGWLFVELNGRVALAQRAEFHSSRAENIVFGADVVESRPAQRYFDGAGESLTALAAVDVIAANARVVDHMGAPAVVWEGWPGPVRLRVKFPLDRIGVAEPLLCTGATGAADLIYVRYSDARHVQLAFDHWGVGGPVSAPIEIDPAVTQEIEASFGALFPPAGSSLFEQQPALRARRDEVRVMLNGRVALAAATRSHPSVPDKIVFGQNPVGASSCVPEFTGTLIGIQPAPEALAPVGK